MSIQYYHRKGKVKLIKDLKTGKAHLRQSLIDISDIEDLTKIYETKKQIYHIKPGRPQDESQPRPCFPLTDNQAVPGQTDSQGFHCSSVKKTRHLPLKTRLTEHSTNRSNSIRSPLLSQLLTSFEAINKNQNFAIFAQQIRASQKNLNHVKHNSRRIMEFTNPEDSSFNCGDRFMSLAAGVPQKTILSMPSFEEIVRQRYSGKSEPKLIDIKSLEGALGVLLKKAVADPNEPTVKEICTLSPNKGRNSPFLGVTRGQNSKKSLSLAHTFQKSENSTRNVLKTMTDYYECKKAKNEDYNCMVNLLRRDRPVTAQLRRQHYQVSGQHITSVARLRSCSEHERQELLRQNGAFYMKLLSIVQDKEPEQVPMTAKLVEAVRQHFRREYYVSQKFMAELQASLDKHDDCLDEALRLLREYAE